MKIAKYFYDILNKLMNDGRMSSINYRIRKNSIHSYYLID